MGVVAAEAVDFAGHSFALRVKAQMMAAQLTLGAAPITLHCTRCAARACALGRGCIRKTSYGRAAVADTEALPDSSPASNAQIHLRSVAGEAALALA